MIHRKKFSAPEVSLEGTFVAGGAILNPIIGQEVSDYDEPVKTYTVFSPSSKTVYVDRRELSEGYNPFNENNKKLLYVGDKITITF